MCFIVYNYFWHARLPCICNIREGGVCAYRVISTGVSVGTEHLRWYWSSFYFWKKESSFLLSPTFIFVTNGTLHSTVAIFVEARCLLTSCFTVVMGDLSVFSRKSKFVPHGRGHGLGVGRLNPVIMVVQQWLPPSVM